ncbi:SH3 domain-containing protein [Maritalea sp.]|uniref:SH3 domain-containing protein n=1 Tax=Maritalea sp. TaxID=2003361 RepID=UPI003EF2A479
MIKVMSATVGGLVGALVFSGTAFASGETMPAGTLYVCDEGTPYIQVLVPNDMNKNTILMLESEQIEMTPTPVASGFGADVIVGPHHWMVHGKGMNELLLMKDDDAPKNCTANNVDKVSDNKLNTASSDGVVSAMGNFSLGGIVRSGPGMDYDKTDSLPYGEPVVLTKRSGVVMDNYEWFQIEYSEGLTGYQWGGIMCSKSLHITGLYEDCPADLN